MKRYFIIFIAFFLLFGVFCVKAQVSETDTVNISALVPETGQGGGGVIVFDTAPPIISDIEVVEISSNSARVNWKTNEPSVPQINYGENSSYSKTFIGSGFSVDNSIPLENLLSETVYHFEIVAIDKAGNRTSSEDLAFHTLPEMDIVSPPNVSSFEAQSVEGKIILIWDNPSGENFAGVQINKSVDSPALNPKSGEIIYSGMGESFEDSNIENKIVYFYTAFSYDNAGNFSSGAIASAVGIKTAEIKPPIPPKPPLPPATPPSDIKNFQTVPDAKNKKITIKWTNPDEESFEEVEIRKSKEFPALNPDEGELVYKGKEISFEDADVEEGAVYYYTAFTVDKAGNYSSGIAASGTLKKLPPSLISGISISDASFISSKEALLLPISKNGKVYIFTNNEINIYYNGENLPQTLKTILLTVGKSSYILSADERREFYKTKFISPRIAGSYPATISVLDFRAGKIFQAKMELVVENYGKVFVRISDLDLLALKVKNYFGLNEQENFLLEGTKITLYKFDENKNWVLWDANKYNQKNPQLTGEEGAFGFMVPNGRYKISVQKEGYDLMEETIDVQDNLINREFEIGKKSDWTPPLISLAILILALIVIRKIRRRT